MKYLRWCIMEKWVMYKSVANIMFFYEQKEELRVKKTFRVVREIISPIELFE